MTASQKRELPQPTSGDKGIEIPEQANLTAQQERVQESHSRLGKTTTPHQTTTTHHITGE